MRLFIYILIGLSCASQRVNSQTANAVGSASALGGDCFSVTPDQQNSNGAVWYSEQLDLSQYFSLTVELNLGTNDWNGADGIMLVMQQVGLDALGEDGQGMGFAGFSPSLGIEFDTYTNSEIGDPASDHMAIHVNGNVDHQTVNNLAGPIAILDGGLNAENGQSIEMRLVWNPDEQEVKVFTNCDLRLSANVDLVNTIFGGDSLVYWGFTGATGLYTNNQTVCFTEASYLNPDLEFDICEGDEIELEINSLIPSNVEWSPNLNISNVNSLTPTVFPTANTTYTVTYEECGEVFTDSFVFNVTALDLEPLDGQGICPGEEGVFQVETDASYAINWSSGAEGLFTEQFSEPGTHWVEVTDGLCMKREEFELVLNPVPAIVMPSVVEYCFSDSTLVTVTSLGADVILPNGSIGSEFYADTEQVYEVQAIDQLTGCESSAQLNAVELPLPVIPLLDDYEICPYETLELSITDSYNVEWSTSSQENSEVFVLAGDYSVEAELDGCTAESTFNLTVNPLPESNVPGAYEFCEDDSLIIENLNPDHSIVWPSGEVAESYRFEETGSYNITVTHNITGCITVENVEVEKKFNPILKLASSYDLCTNEFIIIEPELEHATDIVWSTGETTLERRFNEAEEFFISSTNDCSTTTVFSAVVPILCDCEAFIPLAFTPDGDGINEVFIPILGCSPTEYELIIYNRWGEVLYTTQVMSLGWNGSHQNGAYFVSPGAYTYKLSYTSEQFDGVRTETKYGTVSVIR
ncbi:MAG: gliding motility-associated C-terminal domain-containing protein [Flavobacteriales bacterium]